MKWGSKGGALIDNISGKFQFNFNPWVLGGITLYGLSFVLYTYLIAKYDLGYIIPLTTALVYLIIFTASFFIFHEVFTAFKILGIVMIITGLIFLNVGR